MSGTPPPTQDQLKEYQQTIEKSEKRYTHEYICEQISALAARLAQKFPDTKTNPLIILALARGGLRFAYKLQTALSKNDVWTIMDQCKAKGKYTAPENGGPAEYTINWTRKPDRNVQGQRVLAVDDMEDSGITLKCVVDHCQKQEAAQVFSVLMLNRQERPPHALDHIDEAAIQLPAEFQGSFFGFGLDWQHGLGRDLNDIYQPPQPE